MLKDVSCFLGTQYIGSWKNQCVLLTPRVKPAATRLYLLHTTASNVSSCHVTNDLFHICGFSSGIPAVDVIFTLCESVFWFPFGLLDLLCRYPAEPLTAALLQLHSTIC